MAEGKSANPLIAMLLSGAPIFQTWMGCAAGPPKRGHKQRDEARKQVYGHAHGYIFAPQRESHMIVTGRRLGREDDDDEMGAGASICGSR